ncbi:hypothetical protein CBM2605_B170068 [Cupriavidus neocaledonicus]|uniref:Uncharacterized protein n=1 Tax=Cupriavidus neocaledonicus TaxID=1040979 RepID=A0ABY1VBB4_9BURK|nr:hypothetical protein CBM2605_B170068 [Cupriavidus neocaledonicus]
MAPVGRFPAWDGPAPGGSGASFSPRSVPAAGLAPWTEIGRKTGSIRRIVSLKSGRSLPPCRKSAGQRACPGARLAPGPADPQTTIDSGVRVFSLQRNVSRTASRAASRADNQGEPQRGCRRAPGRAASGARA